MKNFNEKINLINNTKDGIKCCNTMNAMNRAALSLKLSADELKEYQECLMEYCFTGPVMSLLSHALSSLTDIMSKGDRRYVNHFLCLMQCGDEHLEYWAVAAYAKAMEKDGYDELVAFILAEDIHKLSCQANAVKELAALSKQRFDEGKRKKLGEWGEADTNLMQIL